MADKDQVSVVDNEVDENDIIDLSPRQEADLKNHVFLAWESSNSSRVRWMMEKQEGLSLYWGIRRPKDFPFKNCANLHVPLIRTIADTLHSSVMGSLDADRPAAISPVGPEDVPKARKIEKLLNWQITTQLDYEDLVDRIVQSALVFGIAPIKVRYHIEKRGNKKIYDGIKVDLIAPERWLMPADAINSVVDEMDYCIQEIPMNQSDLRKRMKAGRYKKISEEHLDHIGMEQSATARDADDQLENIRNLYSGIESMHFTKTDRKYATILEFYGGYDYNDDGIEEQVMVTMLKETKDILRVVKWDRPRPFVVIKFSEILNKAYGESICDILKHLNQELNTLHNQRVDAITVSNIPFFFFDPVAGFNPNDVVLSPGVGIPTNGPPQQAVYFPQMQGVRPEYTAEEANIFELAERLVGAGANQQGIMESKRVTATEVSSIDRRAGIRFLTIFNRIRKGLKQVFRLILELDKEYLPPEIQVRITGLDGSAPVFETIKQDDLQAQADITVNGNSIMDDQAEESRMMQLYQVGMANPLIVRDETAIYELTRDLYAKLGATRIDFYLRKPEDQIPKNPSEEHNLFLQEEYIEPHINEDVQDHLRKHAELINNPDQFKLFSKKGQMFLLRHYSSTLKMQAALQQQALIQQAMATNAALLHTHMTGQLPPGAMGLPIQPPAEGQGQSLQPVSKPQPPGF